MMMMMMMIIHILIITLLLISSCYGSTINLKTYSNASECSGVEDINADIVLGQCVYAEAWSSYLIANIFQDSTWQIISFSDSSCVYQSNVMARMPLESCLVDSNANTTMIVSLLPEANNIYLIGTEPGKFPIGRTTQVLVYANYIPLNNPFLSCYINGQWHSSATATDSSHAYCWVIISNTTLPHTLIDFALSASQIASPSVKVYAEDACEVQLAGSSHQDNSRRLARRSNGEVYDGHDNHCVCPPGTYFTIDMCRPCSGDSYNPVWNATSCMLCPDNMETYPLSKPAVSIDQCKCKGGYRLVNSTTTTACEACPLGIYCPGQNQWSVFENYWIASNESYLVLECTTVSHRKNRCLGSTYSHENMCDSGFGGPLCQVCKNGTALLGNTCVDCLPPAKRTISFLVLAAIALFLVLVQVRLSTSQTNLLDDGWARLASLTRMSVNHFQMLWIIGRIRAGWTKSVEIIFIICGMSTLAVNNAVINCGLGWSYYSRLTFIFFIPAILVAIAIFLQGIRMVIQKKARAQVFVDVQLISLQLLWIIHPMFTLELLQSFKCTDVGGTMYLDADMSVRCDSEDYKIATSFASLILIFYIGLGGFLFYMKIVHTGKNGDLFDPNKKAMRKYAFFVRGYKRESYLWEMWILLKKLSIIALISFAPADAILIWTTVIIGLFGYLHLINQPHVSELVNRLEVIAILTEYFTVVLGFHFNLTKGDAVFATIFVIVINILCAGLLLLSVLRRFRKMLLFVNVCLPARFKLDEDKESAFVQQPQHLQEEDGSGGAAGGGAGDGNDGK